MRAPKDSASLRSWMAERFERMALALDIDDGLLSQDDEQLTLECPYCGVHAHMTPQAVPAADKIIETRPKHVGLVYQCDSCHSPVFLRFATKVFTDSRVELYRNFVELERPKERFAFSYLPRHTEILFREALSCYSTNNFNAFASMCRRSAYSAYAALGEGGKLRAFGEVLIAPEIAGIDDERFVQETGFRIRGLVGQSLPEYLSLGLLRWEGSRLQLTRDGLLVSDSIWPDFLRK